ncbi:MAG: WXG100 family type VII secretion target [Microbacterium sp.]
MSVNPAQVIALSGQIRTGATGINGHLETLETQVNKLRASWSGEAQEAYDVAQRDWNIKLKELQQLLSQIATKTQEMSEEYTSRDKGSRQRFLA